MQNLDKLLRKIEKNQENKDKTEVKELTIDGETYEIRTFTRQEKREFIYAQDTNAKNMTAGDIVKKMKPLIYKVMNLSELAVKAKDEGYIKTYYDVVEALFEPEQILEIIGFITEINNIGGVDIKEELDELKKQ